jgi:hypothetical protein
MGLGYGAVRGIVSDEGNREVEKQRQELRDGVIVGRRQ